MKNIITALSLLLASGCATMPEESRFFDNSRLGIEAYNNGNPELAVVLLRPAVMSYMNQDTADYLSQANLDDETFQVTLDYLIVSSWEAKNEKLFDFLIDRYGVDLHDTFESKGSSIGDYGKVRIKQIWDCVQYEDIDRHFLEAARCWRSVGNKERSSDNFKAHYLLKGLGRAEYY